MRQFASGSVTGTGAALTIQLGWVPDYFRVVNVTDGTRVDEWFSGMAAGESIAVVTTAGPVLNAADGITPYAGLAPDGVTASKEAGVILGTDISTSTKKLCWLAIRN
jgi:hypothetical protein